MRLTFLLDEDLPESHPKSTKGREQLVELRQGYIDTSRIVSPSEDTKQVRYFHIKLEGLDLNYGIRHIEERNGTTVQFDYETKVSYKNENGTGCYVITKGKTYINNKLPNTVMEELAADCGAVLYPLEVSVSNFSIINTAAIKARWKRLKKELERKYQGTYISNYLEAMSKRLTNDLALNTALNQDLFLSLFKHAAKVKAYHNDLSAQVVFYAPLVPYTRPVRYKGDQNVESHYTRYNTIKTVFKGEVAEHRSCKALKAGQAYALHTPTTAELPKGDCTLAYDTDRYTGMLKFCKATMHLELEEEEQTKTTLHINELY